MLPLLPFYAALLVVLSVFFGPNIRESLPAPPPAFLAVSNQINNAWATVGEKVNFVEGVTESVADSVVDKVEAAYSSIHSEIAGFFEAPGADDLAQCAAPVAENSIWNSLTLPYSKEIYEYADHYGSVGLHVLALGFDHVSYIADVIYDHIKAVTDVILGYEPVKAAIRDYNEIHTAYITPSVEYATEKYSEFLEPYLRALLAPAVDDFAECWNSFWTGQSTLASPVLYIVVIILLFIFINIFTKLSKVFMKDLFWVNQGVTRMYGPTTNTLFAGVGAERDESYDMMKTHEDLVIDEIEELEHELDRSRTSNIDEDNGNDNENENNVTGDEDGEEEEEAEQEQEPEKESDSNASNRSQQPTEEQASNRAISRASNRARTESIVRDFGLEEELEKEQKQSQRQKSQEGETESLVLRGSPGGTAIAEVAVSNVIAHKM